MELVNILPGRLALPDKCCEGCCICMVALSFFTYITHTHTYYLCTYMICIHVARKACMHKLEGLQQANNALEGLVDAIHWKVGQSIISEAPILHAQGPQADEGQQSMNAMKQST